MQNKNLFRLIVAGCIFFSLSAEFKVNNSAPSISLSPTNDSVRDKDFQVYLKQLLLNIKRKDVPKLLAQVSEDIKWSFGDQNGKNGFVKYWLLSDKPNESGLWHELAQAVTLGCNPDRSEKNRATHICPYVYSEFPEAMDTYENLVITGRDVRVRVKPSLDAAILKKVNYEIVKPLNQGSQCEAVKKNASKACADICDWSEVHLYSAQIKGFVCNRFLRSPIDYRAIFEKIKNRWQLTVFVNGD